MPQTVAPTSWLDSTMAQLGMQAAEPLIQDVEQRQRQIGQQPVQPSFSSMIPSMEALLGQPAAPTNQQQAVQPPQPGSWLSGLPSIESLLGPRQQPVQTPSGTPSAMPTAPGLTPATITSGPRPGQTLQPGESVGSVTLSHPEKQAEVYREAIAAGLDDEGARILVAVTETEGGMTGLIGDEGQSRGAFQFYEGGQMPAFRAWVRQQGIQGDPDQLVHDHRLATRFAASTYLGRTIAAGRAQGLSGAELATYVQRHGQVSVNPEKTGQNYQRLYGPGSQVYPDRGEPAVRQNIPTAPLTPPQASDQRTYPERPAAAPTATENPGSAQYQRPGAQRFRVVDQHGNEYVFTQEQMDRMPGGSGHLRIIGPVAMSNAGAGSPNPASAAPASTGAPPASAGLPPTVAQRWDQRTGGAPMTEEDMAQLRALGVMA